VCIDMLFVLGSKRNKRDQNSSHLHCSVSLGNKLDDLIVPQPAATEAFMLMRLVGGR
jgi:hypothetical protein